MSKNRVEIQNFYPVLRKTKLSYERTGMYPVAYKRVFYRGYFFT